MPIIRAGGRKREASFLAAALKREKNAAGVRHAGRPSRETARAKLSVAGAFYPAVRGGPAKAERSRRGGGARNHEAGAVPG